MTTVRNKKADRFQVESTGVIMGDYKGIHITWFRNDGEDAEYLEGCEPIEEAGEADYKKAAELELFTKEEADAVVAYLAAALGATSEDTTIIKIELPLKDSVMPLGAMPCGGGPGILELWRDGGYSLPFLVCGYFDTRFAEPNNYEKLRRPNDQIPF